MKAQGLVLLIYLIEHLTKKNAVFWFIRAIPSIDPRQNSYFTAFICIATSTEHKIYSLKWVQDKNINFETLMYFKNKLLMIL